MHPAPRPARLPPLVMFLAAAAGIAALLHFRTPLVADRDGFYHFRHAAVYAADGPLASRFPWAAHSVIGREGADLWYGFHLALVPFTLHPDPVTGLKLAGVFLLACSLLLVRVALGRLGVSRPEAWCLALLFAGAPGVLRFLAVRPHVLSLGLLALLTAFLYRGSRREAAAASLALAFFHLNLAWMGLVVLAGFQGARWLRERKADARLAAAVLAGLAAGWLLRPNPIGAARLLGVQLGALLSSRQSGVPLRFGQELFPPPAGELAWFLPFALLWLAAAALYLRCRRAPAEPREGALLDALLLLSLAFGALTAFHSARSSDQWKLLALLFTAAALERLAKRAMPDRLPPGVRRMLPRAAPAAGLALAALAFHPEAARIAASGFEPGRMRAAAEWLRLRAPEGSLVFHARWETFAELFFWNTRCRYVSGMDPVFLHALDARRYWQQHHLAGGASKYTSGDPRPEAWSREETYLVLRFDFRASYLLVEKQLQPELLYYARHEPRLIPRFECQQAAVFELADPAPGGGARRLPPAPRAGGRGAGEAAAIATRRPAPPPG